ncbi:MAG: hypothetical protein JXI33_08305 [Candidatus Aminicenantes bacterium]|nr:hypothetical protein [Candidatus Aminicenantes bacterium]
MKKIVIIAGLIICFSAPAFGGDRFFVSAGAAAVYPVDSSYRNFYGAIQFSPELKAGFNFFKGFYVWLGYSFFTSSYTIPVLLEEASCSQHFLALGAGWETRRGRRLQFDFFAAFILAEFREKAMEETVSDFAPGMHVGAAVRYFMAKKIFLGAALSFSGANMTLAETANSLGGSRLLGSLRLGVNLGLRF